MKTKYNLFRRGGMFYIEDTATGKQTSLRTKDETEARSLLNARNEAARQPVLNLHLDGVGTTSRTYTSNSFPASETGPWANTGVAYLYNQQHRINLALTSPASTLNFSNIYDTTWRLQSLVSPEGAFAYTYATLSNYSLTMPSFAPGLVSSITLPNAALITNQYGFQSRLTNTALQNYWGHVLDGYSYTYDEIGQRTSMTRNLGITTNIVTNIFDSIGQLTSWSGQESGGALRFNEQLSFG